MTSKVTLLQIHYRTYPTMSRFPPQSCRRHRRENITTLQRLPCTPINCKAWGSAALHTRLAAKYCQAAVIPSHSPFLANHSIGSLIRGGIRRTACRSQSTRIISTSTCKTFKCRTASVSFWKSPSNARTARVAPSNKLSPSVGQA